MIAQAVDKYTGRWKMRYGTSFLYLIQSSPYLRCFNQCQSYGKNDNLLLLASFIVAALTMDKKNEEIANIEVSDGCVKQGRKGPSEGHDEVTTESST